MSRFDYEVGRRIAADDPPFYALIQAAMRRADSTNLRRLREAFPETYAEVEARYNAHGGILPDDEPS